MGIIRYLRGWRNLSKESYDRLIPLLAKSDTFSVQTFSDSFPSIPYGYEMRKKATKPGDFQVEIAAIQDSMRIVSESMPFVTKIEKGTLSKKELSSILA